MHDTMIGNKAGVNQSDSFVLIFCICLKRPLWKAEACHLCHALITHVLESAWCMTAWLCDGIDGWHSRSTVEFISGRTGSSTDSDTSDKRNALEGPEAADWNQPDNRRAKEGGREGLKALQISPVP